ncbi:MAG: hypothetical protein AAF447_08370 [Myxococcota bacterium]
MSDSTRSRELDALVADMRSDVLHPAEVDAVVAGLLTTLTPPPGGGGAAGGPDTATSCPNPSSEVRSLAVKVAV